MQNKITQIPFRSLRHIMCIPSILAMALPLVFLDICMEIYHRYAFPMYGLPIIRRRSYIKIDRHKLSYLGFFDKLWCMYCGYANGLLNYAVEIASKTETYWCGIKHKYSPDFHDPVHHKNFLEYGDKQAYEKFVGKK